MGLFGIALLEGARAAWRHKHKDEIQAQRDQKRADREIRALIWQGVISRDDSDETRFRKIQAHQGKTPEEIERSVPVWRANFRQITGREPTV